MSNTHKDKEIYAKKLKECLNARPDFKDLQYCVTSTGEYLALTGITGDTFMFDITGYEKDQMLTTVAEVVCGLAPGNYITDYAKRAEIGKQLK